MVLLRRLTDLLEPIIEEQIRNLALANSTDVEEEAAPPGPLGTNQLIMIGGAFMMIILSHDLKATFDTIRNKEMKTRITRMIGAAIFFYICEFMMTLGSVISALCPVALWLLGICHYSIKVIVSYSYSVRVEIAMKGAMKHSKSDIQKVITMLQAAIIVTAVSNLIKVFLTYSSEEIDGACAFHIGGFWGYMDEIMFGAIDLFTLAILVHFYKNSDFPPKTKFVIFRIIYLSTVTLFATVFAVIINVVYPEVGLASSILDITFDIVTMMIIYSRPNTSHLRDQKESGMTRASNVDAFKSQVGSGSKVSPTSENSENLE